MESERLQGMYSSNREEEEEEEESLFVAGGGEGFIDKQRMNVGHRHNTLSGQTRPVYQNYCSESRRGGKDLFNMKTITHISVAQTITHQHVANNFQGQLRAAGTEPRYSACRILDHEHSG